MIIRRYKEGDEKQIVPLLKLVFPGSKYIDEKYWNWMYKNNPTHLIRIWVAEDNEKIVGHYAVMSVFMKVNDKLQTGALSLNIAVHPDYQGRGIFPRLAKQASRELSEEGIVFTYVYPNKRSFPIFIEKLGWFEVPSLPVLFKPLNLEKLLARKVGNRFLAKMINPFGLLFLKVFFGERRNDISKGIDVIRVTSLDDRVDGFWEQASKPYKIIALRDKKYLTWRYFDKPDNSYMMYLAEKEGEMLGYIVLKLVTIDESSKSGTIVDLLTLPGREDVVLTLILKAIEHFKEEEADVAMCYMQNKYCYELLRKIGFVPFPPVTPKLCAQIYTAEHRTLFSDVRDYFITGGDRPHEI